MCPPPPPIPLVQTPHLKSTFAIVVNTTSQLISPQYLSSHPCRSSITSSYPRVFFPTVIPIICFLLFWNESELLSYIEYGRLYSNRGGILIYIPRAWYMKGPAKRVRRGALTFSALSLVMYQDRPACALNTRQPYCYCYCYCCWTAVIACRARCRRGTEHPEAGGGGMVCGGLYDVR